MIESSNAGSARSGLIGGLLLALSALFVVGVSGCDTDSPMEDAAEDLEDAGEELEE